MPRKPPKKPPKPSLVTNTPKCTVVVLGTPYDKGECSNTPTVHVGKEWFCKDHAPAKKSPGPALVRGMKQLRDKAKSPTKEMKPQTTRIAVFDDNDKTIAILHVVVEIPRVTELPAPTDSHADAERNLAEVRSMCEETLRWDAKHYMASKVLRILNSKAPTAKGGRK